VATSARIRSPRPSPTPDPLEQCIEVLEDADVTAALYQPPSEVVRRGANRNDLGAFEYVTPSCGAWSERGNLLRDEAVFPVDRLLVQVARASGAIAVAMGEGLAALCSGDGPMRLGYSGLGDYGREVLSMARAKRETVRGLVAGVRGGGAGGAGAPDHRGGA
jgi:hypothetical protein